MTAGQDAIVSIGPGLIEKKECQPESSRKITKPDRSYP